MRPGWSLIAGSIGRALRRARTTAPTAWHLVAERDRRLVASGRTAAGRRDRLAARALRRTFELPRRS